MVSKTDIIIFSTITIIIYRFVIYHVKKSVSCDNLMLFQEDDCKTISTDISDNEIDDDLLILDE